MRIFTRQTHKVIIVQTQGSCNLTTVLTEETEVHIIRYACFYIMHDITKSMCPACADPDGGQGVRTPSPEKSQKYRVSLAVLVQTP